MFKFSSISFFSSKVWNQMVYKKTKLRRQTASCNYCEIGQKITIKMFWFSNFYWLCGPSLSSSLYFIVHTSSQLLGCNWFQPLCSLSQRNLPSHLWTSALYNAWKRILGFAKRKKSINVSLVLSAHIISFLRNPIKCGIWSIIQLETVCNILFFCWSRGILQEIVAVQMLICS